MTVLIMVDGDPLVNVANAHVKHVVAGDHFYDMNHLINHPSL